MPNPPLTSPSDSSHQPPPNTPPSSSSSMPSSADQSDARVQQLLSEKTALRSQNDSLWKIIEKQRNILQNLQREIQRITNEKEQIAIERDGLAKKVRDLEKSSAKPPAADEQDSTAGNDDGSGLHPETWAPSAAPTLDDSSNPERDEAPSAPMPQSELEPQPSDNEPAAKFDGEDQVKEEKMDELAQAQSNVSPVSISNASRPAPPPRSPFRSPSSRDEAKISDSEAATATDLAPTTQGTLPILNTSVEATNEATSAPVDSSLSAPGLSITPPVEQARVVRKKPSLPRESMLPPPRLIPEHDPSLRAPSPPLPRASSMQAGGGESGNGNGSLLGIPTVLGSGNRSKRESGVWMAAADAQSDVPRQSSGTYPAPDHLAISPRMLAQPEGAEPAPVSPISPLSPRDMSPKKQAAPGFQAPPKPAPGAPPVSRTSSGGMFDSIAGISVRVVGTNVRVYERGKEKLTFIISVLKVQDTGVAEELWRVEKLYSDFLALDAKLKRQESKAILNRIGKLPDKSMFSTHAPTIVEQRKFLLEQYLQHIISLPMRDSSDICEFLSSDVVEQQQRQPQMVGQKEGYLTKRGKSFGGWKKRYFVVKNAPILDYYESKDGSWLGCIKLTHAQLARHLPTTQDSITSNSNNADYLHAFLILEPKKPGSSSITRHILCAETDEERDEWVEVLGHWIGVADPSAPSGGGGRKVSKEEIRTVPGSAHPIAGTEDLVPPPPMIGVNAMAASQVSSDSSTGAIRIPMSKQSEELSCSVGPGVGWRHPARSISPAVASPMSSSLPTSSPLERASLDVVGWDRSASPTPSLDSANISRGADSMDAAVSPYIPHHELHQQQQHQQQQLQPETAQQKKQRARMTFAFTRMFRSDNSSTGQSEPSTFRQLLGGGGGGPAVAGKTAGGGGGEARRQQVFGVPLEEAIRVAKVKEFELPAVVYRCIEYLEAKGAEKEEGIYRLSGSSSTIKMLKERFNNEGDVNLLQQPDYYDVHAITGLLKLYLRELPMGVLTRELHLDFLHVIDLMDRRARVRELGRLVSALPLANYTLLRALTAHLIRIVQNSNINKMTMRNVGIVFAPTLGIPAGILGLLMTEFEYIFYVNEEGGRAPRRLSDEGEEDEEGEEEEEEEEEENEQASQQDAGEGGDREENGVALAENEGVKGAKDGGDEGGAERKKKRTSSARSNRNSVNYMGGAPDAIVGLEKRLSASPVIRIEDEQVADELGLTTPGDDEEELEGTQEIHETGESEVKVDPAKGETEEEKNLEKHANGQQLV
ncbi:uncharacterized protein VTP21DRAFT_9262 [Calcarisporiella thermophila]|uniref:uncharacterized protein n=1 Tax=Calcarisporiella thermophila TaxID=911321 RepID=UPI0037432A1C